MTPQEALGVAVRVGGLWLILQGVSRLCSLPVQLLWRPVDKQSFFAAPASLGGASEQILLVFLIFMFVGVCIVIWADRIVELSYRPRRNLSDDTPNTHLD